MRKRILKEKKENYRIDVMVAKANDLFSASSFARSRRRDKMLIDFKFCRAKLFDVRAAGIFGQLKGWEYG